ncbi:MAG: hypothetical protein IPH60_08895 [Flavobacteriales bacterium]|nr:hypothetical protein [Flavobacteriales bacterium]
MAQAQLVSLYTFAQTAGSYTAISGGTQVLPPGSDDTVSGLQPIGFTFTYNGSAFNQFTASGNGHMRLGSATTGSTPISSTGNTNAISAFGRDGLSVGGVFVQTTGAPGSQICTIEWLNYQPQWNGAAESMNMQIRLYETTNVVEIVYGSSVRSVSRTGQVGLRGSSASTDFNNRTTTTNWAATTAGGTSAATMTFSTSAFPAVGQTYTWTPPVITDAAAVRVFSYDINCFTATHTLAAAVQNSGTVPIDFSVNPLTVTVDVTGAGCGDLDQHDQFWHSSRWEHRLLCGFTNIGYDRRWYLHVCLDGRIDR